MLGEHPQQRRKAMQINSARLGATLYVPATRTDLLAIAKGEKYPELRSVVFDLEDAVLERDTSIALANLQVLARQLERTPDSHGHRPFLFVRPRDANMFARICAMPGINEIDGFVIPKATAQVLPSYISSLANPRHMILPTIETREAFDPIEMRRLREQLIAILDRVLVVRIGGNDLLQTLGCRRSLTRTAYDGPLGQIISNLVATFVPWGFAMSAPVLENFSDMALLQSEIDQDIEHGLLTKTAIHPDQVAMIQRAYMVDENDYTNAVQILDEHAPAVFAVDGVMSEPATHRGWARAVIERASCFGVRPAGNNRTLALVS